jgi:hypothetical protein
MKTEDLQRVRDSFNTLTNFLMDQPQTAAQQRALIMLIDSQIITLELCWDNYLSFVSRSL